MIVAYYMLHNDGGVVEGILDAPGQSTGDTLVDLHEVDGTIATFETCTEASAWLAERGAYLEEERYAGWHARLNRASS